VMNTRRFSSRWSPFKWSMRLNISIWSRVFATAARYLPSCDAIVHARHFAATWRGLADVVSWTEILPNLRVSLQNIYQGISCHIPLLVKRQSCKLLAMGEWREDPHEYLPNYWRLNLLLTWRQPLWPINLLLETLSLTYLHHSLVRTLFACLQSRERRPERGRN